MNLSCQRQYLALVIVDPDQIFALLPRYSPLLRQILANVALGLNWFFWEEQLVSICN